jgi:hypothetical protein
LVAAAVGPAATLLDVLDVALLLVSSTAAVFATADDAERV